MTKSYKNKFHKNASKAYRRSCGDMSNYGDPFDNMSSSDLSHFTPKEINHVDRHLHDYKKAVSNIEEKLAIEKEKYFKTEKCRLSYDAEYNERLLNGTFEPTEGSEIDKEILKNNIRISIEAERRLGYKITEEEEQKLYDKIDRKIDKRIQEGLYF